MRPTPYKRIVKPMLVRVPRTNFGFARGVTVGDFYSAYTAIRNQKYYPNIEAKFVTLATDTGVIDDIVDFEEKAHSKDSKLKVRNEPSPVLYFESEDMKCVGNINKEYRLLAGTKEILIYPLEIMVVPIFVAVGFFKTPHSYVVAVALYTDLVRRLSNDRASTKLNVEVGSIYDISAPSQYKRQKTTSFDDKDIPDNSTKKVDSPTPILDITVVGDEGGSLTDGLIRYEKIAKETNPKVTSDTLEDTDILALSLEDTDFDLPDLTFAEDVPEIEYTLQDLEIYNQFVQHLKKIRL